DPLDLTQTGDGGLELPGPPAHGGDALLGGGLSTPAGLEIEEIAQNLPGLILQSLDPGQVAETLAVEATSAQAQLETQFRSPRHRAQVHLLDIESEGVDPLDPLGDPVALTGRDHLFVTELTPQVVVALGDLFTQGQVGL